LNAGDEGTIVGGYALAGVGVDVDAVGVGGERVEEFSFGRPDTVGVVPEVGVELELAFVALGDIVAEGIGWSRVLRDGR
jgi:hypothetical protein